MLTPNLLLLLAESLGLAGVTRPPLPVEVEASEAFLALKRIGVGDLLHLARIHAGEARLRDRKGMDLPPEREAAAPKGGALVPKRLALLLLRVNEMTVRPWAAHVEWGRLRPFTHGNGRVGRAVWAWQMERCGVFPRSFLAEFYRQTLEEAE